MKTVLLILFSIFIFVINLIAQPKTIHLKNPSFEDDPRAERIPAGWRDCGFPGETAADTHPSGAFEVTQNAVDGATYLGMVTRDNDTWEKVGQKMYEPMVAGQCYIFKISLCRSNVYTSASRETGLPTAYTEPVKLKIWGGYNFCDNEEELGESKLIKHVDWEEYVFTFRPKADYNYILLEAFYKTPILAPYNGNLLIDNASPIIPIDCDSMENNLINKTGLLFESEKNEWVNAFYYNSTLTAMEKKLIIEQILVFVEKNPLIKANTIIEEETKKERKKQKELLIKALSNLGVSKDNYSIGLYKN